MGNYFAEIYENYYIPAEIALVEYSLQEGVTRKYHSLIDPGFLYGKTFDAKQHAEFTHNLPLPPHAFGMIYNFYFKKLNRFLKCIILTGEKDFGKLFVEIMKFLSPETEGQNFEPPILFTLKDQVNVVQSIMTSLCNECFESDFPSKFQILPLQYLFFTLKEAASTTTITENEPTNSIYKIDEILERDKYDYQEGIPCDVWQEN
jgi:protein maelstrom